MKYAVVRRAGVMTCSWYSSEGDAEAALIAIDFALSNVSPPLEAVNAEVRRMTSQNSSPVEAYYIQFDIAPRQDEKAVSPTLLHEGISSLHRS